MSCCLSSIFCAALCFQTALLSTPFWISSELETLDWDPDCEAIHDCTKPVFTLTQYNVASGERVSKSWNLLGYAEKVCNLAKSYNESLCNFNNIFGQKEVGK